jgi:hypothetical protein
MVLNAAVDYTQVVAATQEAGHAKPWLTSCRAKTFTASVHALANFTSRLFFRCGDFAISAVPAAFSV